MGDYKFIRLEVADVVARLVLARPPLNILNIEMMEELNSALERVQALPEVRRLGGGCGGGGGRCPGGRGGGPRGGGCARGGGGAERPGGGGGGRRPRGTPPPRRPPPPRARTSGRA